MIKENNCIVDLGFIRLLSTESCREGFESRCEEKREEEEEWIKALRLSQKEDKDKNNAEYSGDILLLEYAWYTQMQTCQECTQNKIGQRNVPGIKKKNQTMQLNQQRVNCPVFSAAK